MSIRLNQIVKELNVSFETIAALLKKYCHINVSSINETITDEQYEILKEENQKEIEYNRILLKYRGKEGEEVILTAKERRFVARFKSKFERDVKMIKRIKEPAHKTPSEIKNAKMQSKNSKRKSSSSTWSKVSNYKGVLRIVSIPFGGKTK